MSITEEGYVKFSAVHTTAAAIEAPHWKELNDARTLLHTLNLVGVYPNGIGFGNLSVRYQGESFLISGTATGALPVLGPEHYCLVHSFDPQRNQVITEGPIQASSESMTHGVMYRSRPEISCVIHIHSRAIFDGMIRDQFPATPETAANGTPEIAIAIEKLVTELPGGEGQIVLAGHDEGVITYGPTVEKALALITELHERYGGISKKS